MARFRKKPIVIEAVRVTEMMIESISAERTAQIPDLVLRSSRNIGSMWTQDPHLIITTREGNMRANVGDWIIEEVNGEIYPYEPDIFAKTYEPVI